LVLKIISILLQIVDDRALVLELQLDLLEIGFPIHKVGMRGYMLLLLQFVTVDPNFSGVFFSSDLLILLNDLVIHLLPLNFMLFFKGLFLDA